MEAVPERIPCDSFLAFPAFHAGWDICEMVLKTKKCQKNLGGYLGVNGYPIRHSAE
jgi:hypothetical protein